MIKDIVNELEKHDWTTIRLVWESVHVILHAREKFTITYDPISYHSIRTEYDEEKSILKLLTYALKKHKHTDSKPKNWWPAIDSCPMMF